MKIRGFFLKYPFTGTKVCLPIQVDLELDDRYIEPLELELALNEMQSLINDSLKMKADLYDLTPEDSTDDNFLVVEKQLPDTRMVWNDK